MATEALENEGHTGYQVEQVIVRCRKLTALERAIPGRDGSNGDQQSDASADSQWAEYLQHDCLVEERPIAINYNGISHAVMMATPTDLEDFALGFSLAEGILQSPEELYGLDVIHHSPQGIELNLQIHGARLDHLKQLHRTLAGPTGCGLCGKASLEQTLRALPRVTPSKLPSAEAQQLALTALMNHQPLQRLTGAIHAAAWCDREGGILLVREDVGRHNALDKLIGGLHRGRISTADGFVVMSSRASYELIAKAAQCNLGTLVTVSGATAMAAEQARLTGLNLIGFVRNGRQVVYHCVQP